MSLKNRSWIRVCSTCSAVLVATALASSCTGIGPKTIPRDQFDYGAAIASSWKEQLLFNIVGLRYLEAPVFVNVSSVINSYSLEGSVNLTAGANTAFTGDDTLTIGGQGKYADRPTITYTPIAGQKFAISLMTAIPPESLFALVQAGWPAEIILRLTVRSINQIENEWAIPLQRRTADPRFKELLDVWHRLRQERVLWLARERKTPLEQEKGPVRIVVRTREHEKMSERTRADLRFFYQELGLDPTVEKYTLSYGRVAESDTEIVVMTSSILEIMNELAWRIDVPEEHLDEGRTGEAYADPTPLIRVRFSREPPENSYAAIRNRDYWFYVDDRDIISKRTFSMVQVMLSLADSGEAARGPVISITN